MHTIKGSNGMAFLPQYLSLEVGAYGPVSM